MPPKQAMKAMKAMKPPLTPTMKAALRFQKKIIADQVKRDRKYALQAAIDDGSLGRPMKAMKAMKATPSGGAIAGIAAKIAENAEKAMKATPSGGAIAAKIAVEGQITCKLQ